MKMKRIALLTTLIGPGTSQRLLRVAQDPTAQVVYEQELENAYLQDKIHDNSVPAFLSGLAFGSCVSCSYSQACTQCALVRDPVACCFIMTGSFGCVTLLSMFAGIFQMRDGGELMGEANYIFVPFTVGFGIGMSCGFIARKCCLRMINICCSQESVTGTSPTMYGSLCNGSFV